MTFRSGRERLPRSPVRRAKAVTARMASSDLGHDRRRPRGSVSAPSEGWPAARPPKNCEPSLAPAPCCPCPLPPPPPTTPRRLGTRVPLFEARMHS